MTLLRLAACVSHRTFQIDSVRKRAQLSGGRTSKSQQCKQPREQKNNKRLAQAQAQAQARTRTRGKNTSGTPPRHTAKLDAHARKSRQHRNAARPAQQASPGPCLRLARQPAPPPNKFNSTERLESVRGVRAAANSTWYVHARREISSISQARPQRQAGSARGANGHAMTACKTLTNEKCDACRVLRTCVALRRARSAGLMGG